MKQELFVLMRETGIFLGVMPLVLASVGWWWVSSYGVETGIAWGLAAGVCLLCGGLALGVQELAMRNGHEFGAGLSSIAIRTVGPWLMAAIMPVIWPELRERRIFPAFVVCYLLTLTVETILSVCLIQRWERRRGSVKNGSIPAAENRDSSTV